MSIKATSPTTGRPGPSAGGGYKRHRNPDWTPGVPDAGLPAEPPPRRRPVGAAVKKQAEAAVNREKFNALRGEGKTVAEAREILGVHASTAYRYEKARRAQGGAG